MNSYLPQWFADLASISSVIGLFVSIFLFIEARKIRNSFLRRARLPEVTRELKKLLSNLKPSDWSKDKEFVIEKYTIIRGLLENLAPKLPDNEKKKVINFINMLQTKE